MSRQGQESQLEREIRVVFLTIILQQGGRGQDWVVGGNCASFTGWFPRELEMFE